MARMHARKRGKASSTRPYRNQPPEWLSHDKEFIIKKFKNMNSTNMREVIAAGDKKEFMHFLPAGLSAGDKEKVWKLVKN